MPTRKQYLRWADSDSPLPRPPAPLSVQTTFRHLPSSPEIAARVEAEARKLQRYFDRITHCHVVIVAPHLHHRHGRQYAVHIELSVPHERLVINHEPAAHPRDSAGKRLTKQADPHAAHQDIHVVIREVFDAARRRLEDYARRARGDIKSRTRSRVALTL